MTASDGSTFVQSEVYLMHRAVLLLDAIAHDLLADLGLSYPEFLVAMVVREFDAPSQNEVAEGLGLGKSIVSQRVARLRDAGLLTQHRGEENHRTVRLRLTPKGVAKVDEAYATLMSAADDLFSVLGDGRAAFTRQLAVVVETLLEDSPHDA